MIAVSIGRNFDDEDIATAIMSSHGDSFVFVKNDLLRKICKDNDWDFKEIPIQWKQYEDGDEPRDGKFGKYNPNAPKNAAKKVICEASDIVILGDGDYSTTAAAKSAGMTIKGAQSVRDKFLYKF